MGGSAHRDVPPISIVISEGNDDRQYAADELFELIEECELRVAST